VVTHKACQATHQGAFGGIPATGKSVTFDVIDIFTVADGQLTEHWAVADFLSVMQQLGAA
jgi:predicted ester cyclase